MHYPIYLGEIFTHILLGQVQRTRLSSELKSVIGPLFAFMVLGERIQNCKELMNSLPCSASPYGYSRQPVL